MPALESLSVLATTKASTIPDVSLGHVFGQTIFVLIFIVGGLWAISKFYARRRAGGTGLRGMPNENGLKVISRQMLGKDKQLAVVQWGDRKILVGIAGSNITFFADGASETEAPPVMPAPMEFDPKAFGGFSNSAMVSGPSSVAAFFSGNPTQTRGRALLDKMRDATQRG